MIICDFCLQYKPDGECGLGLKIPKGMSCREFGPGIEKFCSDPNDYVDPRQIIQMATFFGMKGTELKKKRQNSVRSRSRTPSLSVSLANETRLLRTLY